MGHVQLDRIACLVHQRMEGGLDDSQGDLAVGQALLGEAAWLVWVEAKDEAWRADVRGDDLQAGVLVDAAVAGMTCLVDL